MNRLAILLCCTLSACAGTVSPKVRIDQVDRGTFTAIHTAQTIETASFHACATPCAWANTHREINSKVSDAYTIIIDVAKVGLALLPGQPLSTNVIAQFANLTELVGDILALIPSQAGTPTINAATSARQTAANGTNTLTAAKAKAVAPSSSAPVRAAAADDPATDADLTLLITQATAAKADADREAKP